jgi:hypothetical protein
LSNGVTEASIVQMPVRRYRTSGAYQQLHDDLGEALRGSRRVDKIGKQPVNTIVQAYYNVTKPEFAADWQLRVQFTFLFPK